MNKVLYDCSNRNQRSRTQVDGGALDAFHLCSSEQSPDNIFYVYPVCFPPAAGQLRALMPEQRERDIWDEFARLLPGPKSHEWPYDHHGSSIEMVKHSPIPGAGPLSGRVRRPGSGLMIGGLRFSE